MIFWLFREVIAFSVGYIGIILWGALILGVLGYFPGELKVLLRISYILPFIFFVERVAGIWFPFLITRYSSIAAGTGFIIYASYATIFMKIFGENPCAASNIRDIILIGLVMGIPSGILVYRLGDFSRRALLEQS